MMTVAPLDDIRINGENSYYTFIPFNQQSQQITKDVLHMLTCNRMATAYLSCWINIERFRQTMQTLKTTPRNIGFQGDHESGPFSCHHINNTLRFTEMGNAGVEYPRLRERCIKRTSQRDIC